MYDIIYLQKYEWQGGENMSKNLFKSAWDGLGYGILYFVIPIAQCIAYAMLEDNLFWFSTLLLTSSLLYDSYTRFDRQDVLTKRKKILCIGIIAGILFAFSIAALILRSNGISIDGMMRYIYLLLFIPFGIATCDFFSALFGSTI